MRTAFPRLLTTAYVSALLAACGGGSGTPSAQQGGSLSSTELTCIDPPELTTLDNGVFVGRFDGNGDESFVLVTRDSDSLGPNPHGRLIRWTGLGTAARLTGVTLFAPGYSCSSTNRVASNGKDLDYSSLGASGGLVVVGLTSYDPPAASVGGTLRYLGATPATRAFSSGPVNGLSYDAAIAPRIGEVAGVWALTDAAAGEGQLVVSSNGAVAGSLQGCTITGTLLPATIGLNLFSAAIGVSGSGCEMAGNTPWLDGFAVAMPLEDGSTQLVLWAEGNNGIDFGFILAIGRR